MSICPTSICSGVSSSDTYFLRCTFPLTYIADRHFTNQSERTGCNKIVHAVNELSVRIFAVLGDLALLTPRLIISSVTPLASLLGNIISHFTGKNTSEIEYDQFIEEWIKSYINPNSINLCFDLFDPILISDEQNLKYALLSAAREADLKTFNRCLSNDKKHEISASVLGTALKVAGSNGHVNVIECLMTSTRKNEISLKELESTLILAACNNHLDVIEYLITSARAHEISAKALGNALVAASFLRNTGIVKCLMTCDRKHDVPQGSIRAALSVARHRREMQNYLIENLEGPRFLLYAINRTSDLAY